MLIQKALLGLPVTFLFFAPIESSPQEEISRQIIPLAIRKMGLDDGEKFYPEQYYGFDDDPAQDSVRKSTLNKFGRSLASISLFGRRSPLVAIPPDPSRARRPHQEGGRWPVAARGTSPQDQGSSLANITQSTFAERLFPPAYLPPFSIHHEESDSGEQHQDSGDFAALELFRRAADALARLRSRQWGCPTGTTSCESIGYPYSCCSSTEKCYKVTDTGLGPVGCCPEGEACGGAVSDCTSGSTACPESLGGGCCIAGYVCEGVGCVKKGTPSATSAAKTSTTTSTTVVSTRQSSTVVVTVVVTETPNGTPTTRTTTITSTPSTRTTSTSSEGGVAPVKPTLATSDSGLPAGPRLPDDELPPEGRNDNYRQHKRDNSRCARDSGGSGYNKLCDVCLRLVPVRRQCRPSRRLLSERIQMRHGQLHANRCICDNGTKRACDEWKANRQCQQRRQRKSRKEFAGIGCTFAIGERTLTFLILKHSFVPATPGQLIGTLPDLVVANL
ncbi:hypothetical protein SEPCBS119000_002807 [Sporothrix epigloea]|uniref:GPI anchored protein n=1 Tax=Sporothrix epigloea TaxID=1892477 RepID=A0ABP0DI73_9PEZI